MRLWHIEVIPMLPRGQLLAQWRELNSVFAKEDQHILINYIYEYPKEDLLLYTEAVVGEMQRRGYKIRVYDKMNAYFHGVKKPEPYKLFAHHHNFVYLEICYFNLKEKFIRGQKDYEKGLFEQLEAFYEQKKTEFSCHKKPKTD
ncbi:pyrimidine dimer DNA glycosylase/endonuclease V [Solibacillus sp. FSL H8-0538]|uniref:pyrimidine dimer DNA glycosylase/endonuclease V n=1 Tax=Solibacillus sp. FSL H8-0538 TaxID=2921400 RepID=UPI0030FD1FAF